MAAPAEKAAAEAHAACQGLAILSSDKPSSSRACAASASRADNSSATRCASSGARPRAA